MDWVHSIPHHGVGHAPRPRKYRMHRIMYTLTDLLLKIVGTCHDVSPASCIASCTTYLEWPLEVAVILASSFLAMVLG